MWPRSAPLFRFPAPQRRITVLLIALAAAVGSFLPTVSSAQPVSLRSLADDAGITLGAAVDADGLSDAAHRSLLAEHVNLLSTRGDLSMTVVQPAPGVFDFGPADAVVDFAVENDMTVRGHELIGATVPDWVSSTSWTAETLSQVLRDHVTAVVGHFRDRNPGVVTQWDVVGNAFLPDGTQRPTVWQQVIGDDYMRIAFEAARAADPNAQLFYDDFYDDLAVTQDAVATATAIVPGANAERTTCDALPKCVGIRDRVASLVGAGTPIDGVGFQSHLFSPDPADFTQLSSWVGDLGLMWAITEFDVPLPVTETASDESLEFQATVYADALAACADAANCDTFVTWGISDRFSPIPQETGGAFGGALWFDASDAAKPAFDAMAQVLAQRAPAPDATEPPASTTDSIPTASTPATDDTSNGSAAGDLLVPVLIGLGALGVIAVGVVVARRRRGPQPV